METIIACTLWQRLRGLFGRDGFTGELLLLPCDDVHTFGMRRAIDVAFLAGGGTVLEVHRSVSPRRRLRCRGAGATLERFARDGPWLEPGERVDLGRLMQAAAC